MQRHAAMLKADTVFVSFDHKERSTFQSGSRNGNYISFYEILVTMTDYDEIVLEGKTYYLVENTLYKATVLDGALYFEVVSNL